MSATVERVGEVTQVFLSTARSRSVGYGVYVFLHRGVLIDTAFSAVRTRVGALLDALRPTGVALTHHHEDHAGNLELVASRGLPVLVAPATVDAVRTAPAPAFYRRVVWGSPAPLTSPLEPLDPGALELVHTPGHSEDHHVVWDAERRTLFAGDLFLGVKVRVARPGEDPRALVRSLRAVIVLRPRLLFDAHRGWVREPEASLAAKAGWIEDALASIDRRIQEGWTDAAITRDVFGRENLTTFMSGGDLSRHNFVVAARRTAEGPGTR